MHNSTSSDILTTHFRFGYAKSATICLLLCSCGGSGGSGVDPQLAALETMRADANRLVEDFSPLSYTDLAIVPTVGTATYQGYLSAQLSNTSDGITDTLIGDLSLQVDFAASNMVTGSAEGFLDENGAPLVGTLTLSNGSLDRDGDPNTDATFTFEGSGQLIDVAGQTLILSTNFEGDFLEDNYSGVGGDILGQVIVDGNVQSLGGIFIGESLE